MPPTGLVLLALLVFDMGVSRLGKIENDEDEDVDEDDDEDDEEEETESEALVDNDGDKQALSI